MARRFLGIDYGTKKVGLAISDDRAKVAFPKEVAPNGHRLLADLEQMCADENIAEIVVGESKNLSGKNNPIQSEILKFTHDLERRTELEVHLEPEYLTTRQAVMLNGERNAMTDASAAALILQSFLDKTQNEEKE